MFNSEEEEIGVRVTLIALLFWLAMAIALLIISAEAIPVANFTVKGLLTLMVIILSTIFWGARAGKDIIRHHKHDDLTGIRTVFIIQLIFYILTILFDGDLSKVIESKRSLTNTVMGFLYYIFGLSIPMIITGIIIGRRITKLGNDL